MYIADFRVFFMRKPCLDSSLFRDPYKDRKWRGTGDHVYYRFTEIVL